MFLLLLLGNSKYIVNWLKVINCILKINRRYCFLIILNMQNNKGKSIIKANLYIERTIIMTLVGD